MDYPEKSINLKDILTVIKHNWLTILVVSIVCGAAAFCYANFMRNQMYQSYCTIFIYNTDWTASSQISTSNINASESLTENAMRFVKEGIMLNNVSSLLNESLNSSGLQALSEEKMKSMVTISQDGMSMTITVKSDSPELSKLVAKTYETVVPQELERFFSGSNILVTTEASKSTKVDKKVSMITLLGILAGGAITFGITTLFHLMDNTIKSEDEFKQKVSIPVLGNIPYYGSTKSKNKGGYNSYYDKQKE